MKIGFTGTRYGMTLKQKVNYVNKLKELNCEELHHGMCHGADNQAHEMAILNNIPKIVMHPSTISEAYKPYYHNSLTEVVELSKKPPLERNHDIVDATDILLATPKTKEEVLRSGTWATIRYARKKGKAVVIL